VGTQGGLHSIYRAPDRAEAERRLDGFLGEVERPGIASFTAFAAGVRLWRGELLAYFDEPSTNGYAEGVINTVKVIKRRAYGLPTFDGFRDRVLLACG
jgi:transposase